MSAKIHTTAIVESGAVIGENAEIGPHAVILACVTLGPGCKVHAGAVLGDEPQDLAYKGAASFVRIGARCVIREHVTIHRGTKEGTATEVGDECFLMANSHLGHNVRLGRRVIVANGALLGGYAEVGDSAFVSGNALVHQFCRIGRLAMLSGGCGISKDVPPFCTVRGIQPNRIAGLNVVGLRRAGMTPADRAAVRKAFALLYQSGLNTTQALERIRAELQGAPVLEFCDFIEASKRGICGIAAVDDVDAPPE
jgi:UDP-N-acetylglucosamine acyltransferase